MCNGGACGACGAGFTHFGGCDHDVLERHQNFEFDEEDCEDLDVQVYD